MRNQAILKKIKMLERVFTPEPEPEDPYPMSEEDFTGQEIDLMNRSEEVWTRRLDEARRLIREGTQNPDEQKILDEQAHGRYPDINVAGALMTEEENRITYEGHHIYITRRNDKYNVWRTK